MEAYYFGQYLIEQGLATQESLETALTLQHKSYLPVGKLALKMGHLTTEQVSKIHREQRCRNSKFLEIAVELGFIKDETIALLLKEQRNHHIHLGDALVQAEVLEPDACARALETFVELETARDGRVEAALSSSRSPVFVRSFVETTLLLLRRFGVAHAKTVKGQQNVTEAPIPSWAVSIDFKGAWAGSYVLSASEEVVKAITAAMMEEPVQELDETCGDCFKEFVNIVVGQAKGAFPDPGNTKMGIPSIRNDAAPVRFDGGVAATFELSLSLRVGGLHTAVVGIVDGGRVSN